MLDNEAKVNKIRERFLSVFGEDGFDFSKIVGGVEETTKRIIFLAHNFDKIGALVERSSMLFTMIGHLGEGIPGAIKNESDGFTPISDFLDENLDYALVFSEFVEKEKDLKVAKLLMRNSISEELEMEDRVMRSVKEAIRKEHIARRISEKEGEIAHSMLMKLWKEEIAGRVPKSVSDDFDSLIGALKSYIDKSFIELGMIMMAQNKYGLDLELYSIFEKVGVLVESGVVPKQEEQKIEFEDPDQYLGEQSLKFMEDLLGKL